ncbi:tail assembly protein [Stenotrophomonas phage vB_SmaS-AXL_1]|uniref:tail assembly protein n=1 Tax=Stenotrophomonas phage vB_SmaS-AXL_1 TaxID=2909581 RepID=UPI00240A0D6F|nr:tail assembly protein [Stenotrophomonas phage vB_SmaS-AXL_1]UIS24741.1 tail assembly protein [Stenotrophomonas phage vB_SmaS-AXL_1]
MTVRVYSSADVGAPVLTGSNAGDLLNLLTKCLVDGYGSKAGAGWTKPYTATNRGAFKTGTGSRGRYLYVDDTRASATYAARVYGMDTMTGIDAGEGRFPADSVVSGGLYWHVHYTGSTSAARPWVLVASEKMMYLYLQNYPDAGSTNTQYREFYWFGDYDAFSAANTFNTCIQGKASSGASTSEQEPFTSATTSSSSPGLYAPRSYTGLGGAIQLGRRHDYGLSGSSNWGGNGTLSYPHGPDGALMLSPVWIHEPGSTNQAALLGKMPGLWAPLQYVLNTGDTFQGAGDLAGKTFTAFRQYEGRAVIETSNTWS